MSFNLNDLIRPNIAALVPYSSARSEYSKTDAILLDANENAHCLEGFAGFNRYPDPLQMELKASIAKLKNVGAEQIFLGNGSDEAIDLLIRAFCEPAADSIVTLAPSYGMYEVCAQINNIEVIKVLLAEDFSLDFSGLLNAIEKNTKLIFLCSPNNPSANLLGKNDIWQISKTFQGLVVVDEAYIDFAKNGSCLELIADLPNLVVLQTFSKAWALAGIRLGMCFASAGIIEVLNKIKPPYNINSNTIKLGLEVLKQTEHKEAFVSSLLAEREAMAAELKTFAVIEKVFPSDANFLLVRTTNAPALYDYLLSRNIVTRRRDSEPRCENCLRITVGTSEENQSLLSAIRDYQLGAN